MKIDYRPLDDLKTERSEVTPPLPLTMRLVPWMFYLAVVGGVALSAYFLFVLRGAAAEEARWKAEAAASREALARLQKDRESVEKRARRANDIVAWVESARSLQPLVVAMIRSIDATSSIAELGLARSPGTANQIKMTLKLNTQTTRQLDRVLEQVSTRDFRTYSPNQTIGRGEIDYEATLIYQGARGAVSASPAPSPATPKSATP